MEAPGAACVIYVTSYYYLSDMPSKPLRYREAVDSCILAARNKPYEGL